LEAAKDWDRAIALADAPSRPWFRLQRALALAHAGEHARANALANSLVNARKVPGPTLYGAARVHAISATSIKNDTRLADQYAVRAVELLVKAQQAGVFKNKANIALLKKDSDLASLRSRDDYKKLVADLEGAIGKGK
jgi:hypothetical protein